MVLWIPAHHRSGHVRGDPCAGATMWMRCAAGAKRLVTTCPSCYHTWREIYPDILGESLGFEVLHVVELLDELLDEGACAWAKCNRW